MRTSYKIGFSFGLTSGIITTLGLMVGLNSSTQSKLVVIGGILTIAIADSFSDATGVHMAQEAQNHIPKKDVWEATIFTLLNKFIFSSIFIVPVLIFELNYAIILSVLIGFYLIFLISLIIARERNEKPTLVIVEHLIITGIVIILSHLAGTLIHSTCG